MAKKLKVGDVIRDYRITKVFGPGMMAISYGAVSPSGELVFFKQYKSPAPTVVWYNSFVAYQRELSSRVKNGKAARFAVAQLDAFEEIWGGPCYFQAFEFVKNGDDLQKLFDAEADEHRRSKVAPSQTPAVWSQHVTWAKVLMAGIEALHQSKIAHADLKPANIYLIRDPTIKAGYQLKLIDMDFSLLTDHRAPWHGHQGYIGSDNYRSPEHLTRRQVPDARSDIFTCGLILSELLAGRHPYWSDDQGEYTKRVLGDQAKPLPLVGTMPLPAQNSSVSLAIHRCLSSDPTLRPTASELRAVLSGSDSNRERSEISMDPVSSPTASDRRKRREPITADLLQLQNAEGGSLSFGVRTELTRSLMQQLGPEAQFWDAKQCILDRNSQGQWVLTPQERTVNETLLNGVAVTGPVVLGEGDSIAVGRAAKGVVKMPLLVRGG
ncbi:protein kinase [Bradyrhizobium sp. AUGA SZCCT0222]|uniref:protein kinase domain-containing protein n=1 Tax=Bradyrhizobium sp. AUGA SZCCT0222 TaxID=2807668 RepID=UPI001BAA2E8F|nr:protein kinase [Bradyrhizobium sp. AUGA SZCCT0222]MBR1272746.1 protein kinase [Bradyrhizobium sp. AUGA SZCCT0222]